VEFKIGKLTAIVRILVRCSAFPGRHERSWFNINHSTARIAAALPSGCLRQFLVRLANLIVFVMVLGLVAVSHVFIEVRLNAANTVKFSDRNCCIEKMRFANLTDCWVA
jgi:hypothetical protein